MLRILACLALHCHFIRALTLSASIRHQIQHKLPRDDLPRNLNYTLSAAKKLLDKHGDEPSYILSHFFGLENGTNASNLTVDADPGCAVLFGSKLVAIGTLSEIRYYLETMTSNQYLNDSKVLGLRSDLSALITSISSICESAEIVTEDSIWTILNQSDWMDSAESAHSANRSLNEIIKCRNELMVSIQRKYSDHTMPWHHRLKSTMEFVADLIISKPTFFGYLFALNLSVIDVLGHGSYGTVYRVQNRSFPDTFYAAKHFDDVALCRHEERILMMFEGDQFDDAPIAHLVAHKLVNCSNRSGILMQYVGRQCVYDLPPKVALQHHLSGDPLHFIRDLGDEMRAALTDYVHPAGVYHEDINSGNILYDVRTKRFYLIDFGIAHNLKMNSKHRFEGSWQNYGPTAYDLMVETHNKRER